MWRMWLQGWGFGPLKHTMCRVIALVACLAACLVGCSGSNHSVRPYGAQGARFGESLALLGWNMSVSNLRWDGDFVLIDVSAAVASPKDPHAPPAIPAPLSAPPDRLTGTVCLGPLKDRSQVRGVYRMPDTSATYPAAFPVGLMPTNANDTGLVVKTVSLSAWRAATPGHRPATATCCWGWKPAPSRPGIATTPPSGAAR
jgi:hypothetical protein